MPVEHPVVRVEEITSGRDKLVGADTPTPPDLGGKYNLETALIEGQIGDIMAGIRRAERKVYELTWEGSKIPRGAKILGKAIAWTQHGIVTAEDGTMIGTYERIEEFGGPNGTSQKMHVYVVPPKLVGENGESL